ncbi:MAG: hypothetical protein JXB06_11430 [Spirochaetales bacterium]|nr:hypothetical protein [Spirochaetales bacterium]
MLRAQASEGLLTLVPILLFAVISILLRARASRRRRKRTEAESAEAATRTAAKIPAGQEKKVSGRKTARERRFPWQRESAAAYPQTPTSAAPAPPFAPAPPARGQAAIRESYAYPPPLSLNDIKTASAGEAGQGPAVMPRPVAVSRRREGKRRDLRERLQARMRSERSAGMAEQIRPLERSSITARLERLPPLKRAVIWAEILGPPGGRGHPDAHM